MLCFCALRRHLSTIVISYCNRTIVEMFVNVETTLSFHYFLYSPFFDQRQLNALSVVRVEESIQISKHILQPGYDPQKLLIHYFDTERSESK